MKISVVVACLNAEASIGRCLESIAGQDFADVEAVVADGNSWDRSIEVLRRHAAAMDGRLVWFSEPDRGIADAWNKAVARSSGEWLLFLGADDALAAPNVLSQAAAYLARALPAHRVVYGRVAMETTSGSIVDYIDRPWVPENFRGCGLNLPHQAVFHHRSLFQQHGEFDAAFTIVSDYDFLLRELMLAEPLYIPHFTVTNMRIGGLSTNRGYAPKVVMEEIRLFRRHVGGIPFVLAWWLVKTWGIAALYCLGGDRLALPVSNFYRRLVGGRAPLQY